MTENTENTENTEKKVCEQVEYYFGDFNLRRDKFLLGELKKDNGWVPLNTMLKFNRLAAITDDVEKIAVALEKSHLIEVSDDKTKIRRDPEVPTPENTLEYWREIKARTAYAKGFPLDTTLDEVMKFAQQIGEVTSILLRRTVAKEGDQPRIFKGSVFITFADAESAKRFLDDEGTKKFKDQELTKMTQKDYWTTKAVESRKRAEEAKKQAKKEVAKKQAEKKGTRFLKGCLLKVTGFAEDVSDYRTIKEFFQQYGDVAFVDEDVSGKGVMLRLNSESEDQAVVFLEELLAETGTGGKVKYGDQLLTAEVVTGDEETEYWAKVVAAKAEKFKKVEREKEEKKKRAQKGRDAEGGKLKGKKGKAGKRGGKKRTDQDQVEDEKQADQEDSGSKGDKVETNKAKKRHAEGEVDAVLPPKPKRIVFNEEEEEEEGGDVNEDDVDENGVDADDVGASDV